MLFHGGNGPSPVGGLELQGIVYGVTPSGDLTWNRYRGAGLSAGDDFDPQLWDANTGNAIGRGFGHMKHVFGCGDGVIMAVHPNGNLHWYSYSGNGERDPTGSRGWHANSGNVIHRGWQGFRHIFVAPRAGPLSSRLHIFGVAENGDLYWYSYDGEGENDPSGSLHWHPNSGNQVGTGWQHFRLIHGSGNVFFGVRDDGYLHWYSYEGHGEEDPDGGRGWVLNSGNPIGRSWQGMRLVFGGVSDQLPRGFGHVIMAVDNLGDLRWYGYHGQGERDETGGQGWYLRSGTRIGRGW